METSLRSAYQQIDPDFKIIVVCHEMPQLQYSYDDRVEFINVDFPPPSKIVTDLTMKDKWQKLQIGMVRVGELNTDFIMFMDADDLVSNKLSQYANSNKSTNGWIIKKGYKYRYGSSWIYIDEHFNCGTNAIVNSQVIKFPKSLNSEDISQCVVLKHSHTVIEQRLAALGTPLTVLPFPGAVYIHSHGDNDSSLYKSHKSWYGIRHFLGNVRRTRFLTSNIKEEFSLNF
ncbi:glycosyltransferase family A protein [Picosynechococcus sp. PCC 11901]|uniref:glycosyltransferase family A protein n=1 Tax=Picosynechococcus sp. PCC 11901 TaxID=2579791 RepID=UPI0030DA001B